MNNKVSLVSILLASGPRVSGGQPRGGDWTQHPGLLLLSVPHLRHHLSHAPGKLPYYSMVGLALRRDRHMYGLLFLCLPRVCEGLWSCWICCCCVSFSISCCVIVNWLLMRWLAWLCSGMDTSTVFLSLDLPLCAVRAVIIWSR